MPSENNEVPTPGAFIKVEMERRGWTQRDLALILGRPLPTVNEIINGKRAIMPEMAVALSEAIGSTPEVWLSRESNYQLSNVDPATRGVRDRASLYEVAPIKEMIKRGWIGPNSSPDALRAELLRFFDTDDLEKLPTLSVHTKKTGRTLPLTTEQLAWCVRARNLAQAVTVEQYTDSRFNDGLSKLRTIAAWPEEVRRVPRILASMGVRFVVVEPLMRTKVDGAAFWLDESSPVVAVSARYDRIDSFWHSLCHELSHIKHRDGTSIDAALVGDDRQASIELDATERRADAEGAAFLIDSDELQDFINRVGPMYSTARINQFANKLKIHPGIIVGQLQHRAEIGYGKFRRTLVKVRDFVTSEAITDGWGQSIEPPLPRKAK